jgi:hypothetical protein
MSPMVKKKNFYADGSLKVATPLDHPELRERGILIPDTDDLDKDGEIDVPFDLTAISSRHVGRLHSHFAVRHAHALVENAKVSEQMARLKRNLGLETAKFRFRHQGEYKTKYELDDAMAQNSRIARLQAKLGELEALHIMLAAVVESYEGLRNAASREIARRGTEQGPRD